MRNGWRRILVAGLVDVGLLLVLAGGALAGVELATAIGGMVGLVAGAVLAVGVALLAVIAAGQWIFRD